jgi:hypothetical protein
LDYKHGSLGVFVNSSKIVTWSSEDGFGISFKVRYVSEDDLIEMDSETTFEDCILKDDAKCYF